jgi:ribosomal protein L7/L12
VYVCVCSIKLEGVLERREREEMFRVEYKQRAVEEKIQAIKKHKHNTEWILMDCEDNASRKRNRIDEDDANKQERLYGELLKVRTARKQVSISGCGCMISCGSNLA